MDPYWTVREVISKLISQAPVVLKFYSAYSHSTILGTVCQEESETRSCTGVCAPLDAAGQHCFCVEWWGDLHSQTPTPHSTIHKQISALGRGCLCVWLLSLRLYSHIGEAESTLLQHTFHNVMECAFFSPIAWKNLHAHFWRMCISLHAEIAQE